MKARFDRSTAELFDTELLAVRAGEPTQLELPAPPRVTCAEDRAYLIGLLEAARRNPSEIQKLGERCTIDEQGTIRLPPDAPAELLERDPGPTGAASRAKILAALRARTSTRAPQ